jgi:hypothetical protein
MGAGSDLYFIVDCDNSGFVNKTAEPLFGKSSIPGSVYARRIRGRNPGSIREQTVAGIGIEGIVFLLVFE